MKTVADIRCHAAVIGSGTMGAGIATLFASAGITVDLLDIPSAGADRDSMARQAIARLVAAGGLSDAAASRIRPGNVADHLDRLAAADQIIEAVIEEPAVKRDLYRRVDALRRPGSIVSSNTSTIPRAALVRDMGEGFARDFVITHFFNPPQTMPLLEIVLGPENPPGHGARLKGLFADRLNKKIVTCRDTPGFIANRIGCYWIAMAILEAQRLGLGVDEADAVNAAFGVPRTGVFGLLDLIGLDLVPTVWAGLMQMLPPSDDLQNFDLPGSALLGAMLSSGRLGRKAGQGFWRKAPDGSRQVLDLASGDYRPAFQVDPGGLTQLLSADGSRGSYARSVLGRLVSYAATHGPAIADDIGEMDAALVHGYSWQEGPFRLMDRLGQDPVRDFLKRNGLEIPPLLDAAQRAGSFYPAGAALSTGAG